MKQYLPISLLLVLTLSIAFTGAFFIASVSAEIIYDSSIVFNNTKDANGNFFLGSFYLINVTGATEHGPYTLNSTGGYSLSGIGNGTTYRLKFYWQGTEVHQTEDFTTSTNPETVNIVGPYTLSRFVGAIDGSSVSFFIMNATGVSLISVEYSDKVLRATVNASSGAISVVKVFHGADLVPPTKVFIGGEDVTAYSVAEEAELGKYPQCWYYDSANRVVVLKGIHSSSLTYEVQFKPAAWTPPPWLPNLPQTITIFNTAIPILLLALLVLAVIVIVGGAFILVSARH